MTYAEAKAQAHDLIDRIAPSRVSAAVDFLETLLDPVAHALANAPYDDEELTAETQAALTKADDWSKRNQGIPHRQVLAELGITEDEIKQFQAVK
jgi:hypothetical protein